MIFTRNAAVILLSAFVLPGISFAAHPATWSEFVSVSKQQMQQNQPQQAAKVSSVARQKTTSVNNPPASLADIVAIKQARMQKNSPAVSNKAMQQNSTKLQPVTNMPTTWGQAIEHEKRQMKRQ